MKEIIFDSNIHKWKYKESKFDSFILNKENLLFLIETNDKIKFGGFVSSKIDKIVHNDDNKIENYISDSNSFIFTFKDNKPMKFDIKKDNKYYSFRLYNEFSNRLFGIGYNDIVICKQYKKSTIYQFEYSSYDYQGIEKAVIGKIGYQIFSPKRILVIQMR